MFFINIYNESDCNYIYPYYTFSNAVNFTIFFSELKDLNFWKKFKDLIQRITTKGNKFGFFRSIAINGNGDYLPDNKAFFISFDKNKIYKIKKDKNAVKFDNNTYINTANFNLIGNILSDKYTCPDKDSLNLNFEGFTEEYELTCGEKEFYVKKFEVYQLEFSD